MIKYCKSEGNVYEKYVHRLEDLPLRAVAFIATLIMSISTADPITCCSNMFPALRLLSLTDC
jgi:hypothetical protein